MRFRRKNISTLVVVAMLHLMLMFPVVPAVTGAAEQPSGTVQESKGAGQNDARADVPAVSVPNVVAGLGGQAGHGFAIAETAAGAFNKDSYIILDLPDHVWFSAIPQVEITAGDLRVGNIRTMEDGNQVSFQIEEESTTPGTITVSGVSLRLDRTVAEGDITLKIKGGAVVETQSFGDWTNSDYAGEMTIAKVVTPAPGAVKYTSVFTIGSQEYIINGSPTAMDAAPFIDANGRTMLPLRFAASAAGISDHGIIWDEAGRGVTLVSGNRIVKLVVGSATMTINGVPFEMDTVPIIADPGRVMLPVRSVAQALGCEVIWDEAARTVTVNKTN